MEYRGKLSEREEARRLRALGRTMPDIATALGVSRSSVSLWTRDVPVVLGPRRLRPRQPNVLERRKSAEIAELLEAGRARIGALSDRDLLIAGVARYAGEGSKRDGIVGFTNTDPSMVAFFCSWFRRFFDIDESPIASTPVSSRRTRRRCGRIVPVPGHFDSGRAIWQAVSSGAGRRHSKQQAPTWLRLGPVRVCQDASRGDGVGEGTASLDPDSGVAQ